MKLAYKKEDIENVLQVLNVIPLQGLENFEKMAYVFRILKEFESLSDDGDNPTDATEENVKLE